LQSAAVKVEDNYLFINNKKYDFEEFHVVDYNKEADRIISSSASAIFSRFVKRI
jgi:hypothetical protein